MSILSWQKAHRYPGGIIKYLYDLVAGDSSKVSDLETAIGKASGTGAGGILKDVKDCKDAIGDEDTEGTILYRLKELEKG